MTEAMPFLQKYDITFLRPPTIGRVLCFCARELLVLQGRGAFTARAHRRAYRPREDTLQSKMPPIGRHF